MLITSVRRNSIALGIFALVTSGILAITLLATEERIATAERRAAEQALLEIVPRERHDNDMLSDRLPVPESLWPLLGLKAGGDIHIARTDGEWMAIIVPAVAPDGYSGNIKMIVGINRDGSLAGVRVLNHQETPGLGDKVELKKSDWILGFNGKSLNNPSVDQWKVKKDQGVFDQFTGATITPRAVVQQVKRSLQFFEAAKALPALKARLQSTATPQEQKPSPEHSGTLNSESATTGGNDHG